MYWKVQMDYKGSMGKYDLKKSFLGLTNSSSWNAKSVMFCIARFIQDWVFHGICRDVYGEFLIAVNDDYLHYRGEPPVFLVNFDLAILQSMAVAKLMTY